MKDSQGNVIARRDFKPFGEEISSNTGERTITAKYGAADNLRQKFTTYQRDEETGLDFAEARMYENRHGRFTAVDPLLASGTSANRPFVYVLNSQLTTIKRSQERTKLSLETIKLSSETARLDRDSTELMQPVLRSIRGASGAERYPLSAVRYPTAAGRVADG